MSQQRWLEPEPPLERALNRIGPYVLGFFVPGIAWAILSASIGRGLALALFAGAFGCLALGYLIRYFRCRGCREKRRIIAVLYHYVDVLEAKLVTKGEAGEKV
jgi:hypothetical protein